MKRVSTIPPDLCFVTTLAEGLWARAQGDPLALSHYQIFLPTRRACRVLRDAFLRVTGAAAALLPRMQPLGDVDEVELDFTSGAMLLDGLLPAISPLRRSLLLAELIRKKDADLPWDQALALAQTLAALLDQMQTEGKDWSELHAIVPQDYAEHWQETLTFLEIVTKVWPDLLEKEGCMDPAARRFAVLSAQAREWKEDPPTHPVLIAGSTGSIPAVGALMSVVAGLPQGEIVLPGLDLALEEEAWQDIDETHPQYTMKAWLEKARIERKDVSVWLAAKSPRGARVRLLHEALRPASATESWRRLKPADMPGAATKDFYALELDHVREEADVIALRLRAALEDSGKTAALITPDRALAARVAASLRRWGIVADDSAGAVLSHEPVGSFLSALLAAADPEAGAVESLALLKHPLMMAGQNKESAAAFAHKAEIVLWRGVRRCGGWRAASQGLREKDPDAAAWLGRIADILAPLTEGWNQPKELDHYLTLHQKLAEALAVTPDQTGADRLWRGEAGEDAAMWLDDLRAASFGFPALTGGDYKRLFGGLLSGVTVRSPTGQHPRLDILGPLEARLVHHDVVVLGGLNEGTWPPAPSVDPWLSRPMKRALHLPTPERRVGLSAHDFVQLASAPEVMITRAARVGGAPTVPSRFLMQIRAVLKASRGEDVFEAAHPWRAWARAMDTPEKVTPMSPPRPCPPVAVRPKELPVTDIGLWQRNPYAIYAKRILGLKKLDDVEADVTVADKGEVIHAALEAFIRDALKVWPQDPLRRLLDEGRKAFAAFADRPQVAAFWWPRFENLARWFVEAETKRRATGIVPLAVEQKGQIIFGRGFTLTGRADRIDKMPDGGVEIIDYKTGYVPTETAVYAGYEPQLPLLALIAAEGGFGEHGPLTPSLLSYWGLKGGSGEEKITSLADHVPEAMDKARVGLQELLEKFALPETPYEAVPKPRLAPRYDDYAHLARLAEWGRVEGGGE